MRHRADSVPRLGEEAGPNVRIVGEGRDAASWIQFTNADGTLQPGLCFFELDDDGRIAKITDFWPDPYDLPQQRSHLVEPY